MRALGIDPGLVRTGWAMVEPAGLTVRVSSYGLIAPARSQTLPERLADGAHRLREVLERERPDVAALEEVFTAPRHPKSALLMAHMRGVICLVLQEAGVPIEAFTATMVKQRLTGGGHASKEQVQRMIQHLTDLPTDQPLRLDVTDAVALGLTALHQSSEGRDHPLLALALQHARTRL